MFERLINIGESALILSNVYAIVTRGSHEKRVSAKGKASTNQRKGGGEVIIVQEKKPSFIGYGSGIWEGVEQNERESLSIRLNMGGGENQKTWVGLKYCDWEVERGGTGVWVRGGHGRGKRQGHGKTG